MIIGDPSKFAITWSVVDEWSTSTLKNGVLNIYINLTLLGNRKNIVHELETNLSELTHHAQAHKSQCKDGLPSNLSATDIEMYEHLYEYTFPTMDNGQPTRWEYLAAPYSVYDEDDCLFLVRDVDIDLLYYGRGREFLGAIHLPAHYYEIVVQKAQSLFAQ